MRNDPFMDSIMKLVKERKKKFRHMLSGSDLKGKFKYPIKAHKDLPAWLGKMPKGKSIGRKMTREDSPRGSREGREKVTGLKLGRR